MHENVSRRVARDATGRATPVGVLLVALLALMPGLADAAGATLERVKATGTIRFAYREAAAPFSFKDAGGRVRGYAVELCERVAESIRAELGLAKLDIRWLGADASNRMEVVAKGAADAECGTTTITLGRMAEVDFSVPYFVDGGSVLVRAQAGIVRLADLKGRRIAVIPRTTTERALLAHLGAAGAQATQVPVADVAEGLRALAAGSVDGVAGDRIVLAVQRMRLADPAGYAFVADDFSYEPYAVVVRRDDPDFRLAVNRALVRLYRSGDVDPIFQRWFGELGQPGQLLHAMFYLQQFQD
jgi:ABC-type amino acid transport substrate-binding protein